MRKLLIIALCAFTAFSGVVPANAFPVISAPKVQAAQQVENVEWRHRGGGHGWHGGGYRPHRWQGGRHYGGRYYGGRYYRGDRGWGPGAVIGGLAAGAIIGGALAQPRYVAPPRYRYSGGNGHVQWCYDRYRSYRASDNTFQPNYGPRRQCRSPY